MPKVKVTVGKNEIKKGEPSNTAFCPIALASGKLGLMDVEVEGDNLGFGYISEDYGYDTYSVELPKAAQKFIEKFDEHEKVSPFSFVVNIPNDIFKLLKLKKSAKVGKAKAAKAGK